MLHDDYRTKLLTLGFCESVTEDMLKGMSSNFRQLMENHTVQLESFESLPDIRSLRNCCASLSSG